MSKIVRVGNRLVLERDMVEREKWDELRSPVYDVPRVLTRTAARRGFVRRTGPNGEHVPGSIVETVIGSELLSMHEMEAALVDAAEQNGIDRNSDAAFHMEEQGEPGMREKILRERESRGLVSYPGRAVRRKRLTTGKQGKRAS